MSHEYVAIPVSATSVTLEAQRTSRLEEPTIAVVLCHPHPQFGGTMDNNVVTALFHACREAGLSATRFNFRGVGRSTGRYDEGRGEVEDVRAVVRHVQREDTPVETWIVGYSFGAAMGAVAAARASEVTGFVSIAFPFLLFPTHFTRSRTSKPKLFLQGTRDDFTPGTEFTRHVAEYPGPTESTTIPDADHFFRGKEAEVATRTCQFLLTLRENREKRKKQKNDPGN